MQDLRETSRPERRVVVDSGPEGSSWYCELGPSRLIRAARAARLLREAPKWAVRVSLQVARAQRGRIGLVLGDGGFDGQGQGLLGERPVRMPPQVRGAQRARQRR